MRHGQAKSRILALLLAVLAASLAAAQQKPGEEPLWLDFDMQDIPEPREQKTLYAFDFLDGTFFQQVKEAFDLPRLVGGKREAYNVNSVDEVPDSSWFTNRNGRKRMTLEEIKRGPNRGEGPAPGPVTVIYGKTSGISAGFRLRDARGDVYFVKFDPPDYPELATGAEMVSTKLFYAIGYNVPENYLCRWRREDLRLDPEAPLKDANGRKRAMTEADLDNILSRAHRSHDGTYRCVASKALDGKPKGGFGFHGVRNDDPNDIIPHEHRRDVRALRLFSAWLEHNDIRVGNTEDFYVEEGGRRFLRHYLIDFGSTLGSDTVFPNKEIVGREHISSGGEAAKVLFSLGLYQQPWLDRKGPPPFPSIGYYSAGDFDPAKWKSNFPLPAFDNLTERDAAWAARVIASFTAEQIRAAVETAEYSDPQAAEYLARQIIARRDKIVNRYLGPRAPLLAGQQ